MPVHIVILTGGRGVGKSTVCQRTVELARAGGHTCGGVVTLRHADGSREVLDARTGHRRRLTVDPDFGPCVIQGRFCFDPQTLAWADDVLAQAVPCHLLVVDELGPMELVRGEGWARAIDVLERGDFALAIVVVRPELLALARRRLPSRPADVLTVTLDNRDAVPGVLLEMLEAANLAKVSA
jgi:nucleoside-triphosphatase THEP1